MNLDYLTNVILPQREKELAECKNAGTLNPIYIVFDLQEQICSGHTEYALRTTISSKQEIQFGYIDTAVEPENRVFSKQPTGKKPEPVTRFFTDVFVAFFLTHKAAHEYLQYQSHNLTDNAFVYVFSPGYRNVEMEMLFSADSVPGNLPKLPERVVGCLKQVSNVFGNFPDKSLGKEIAQEAKQILEQYNQ